MFYIIVFSYIIIIEDLIDSKNLSDYANFKIQIVAIEVIIIFIIKRITISDKKFRFITHLIY